MVLPWVGRIAVEASRRSRCGWRGGAKPRSRRPVHDAPRGRTISAPLREETFEFSGPRPAWPMTSTRPQAVFAGAADLGSSSALHLSGQLQKFSCPRIVPSFVEIEHL